MIKLKSWSRWDDDGLIEVVVDQDVLRGYAEYLEMQIADAVVNHKYTKASELISERENVIEKLEELKDGKSAD